MKRHEIIFTYNEKFVLERLLMDVIKKSIYDNELQIYNYASDFEIKSGDFSDLKSAFEKILNILYD